nr:MAG TPA: hypothetical protein [Caudoviricetes sp.]
MLVYTVLLLPLVDYILSLQDDYSDHLKQHLQELKTTFGFAVLKQSGAHC